MILKPGAKGDDVKALQLQLVAHGFNPGQIDGDYGEKTVSAVRSFQRTRGIVASGAADLKTWNALFEPPPALKLPGVSFHDRRQWAAQSHHGYAVRARLLSKVTGICLHQAAVDLGEHPERYDTGGAHVFITRGGAVIWEHDWDTWVCAANGWNDGTISIEVSGRYCGVEGDRSTYWRNPERPEHEPQYLTPESALALEQTIRWVHDDVAARGGSITKLVAHRQASASRRSDPGEAIWKAAAPIAAEFGLTSGGPGFKLGDGRPIPREWDEGSAEPY